MEHPILTGLCLQPETINPNGGLPMKGVINKSMECPLHPFVHSADGIFFFFGCAESFFYCLGFSLAVAGEGYSLVAVRVLLTEMTSLVQSVGSRARRFSSHGTRFQ